LDETMEKRGWLTILLIFGGLFVALVAFSLVLAASLGDGGLGFGGEKIGVVEIEGPITSSKQVREDLRQFRRDDSIKGIVVRINSPGGAVAPSQELFHAVQETNKEKPLAVTMGSTAASGGYYIACGADQIFANAGTITGSIGVITQFFNIQKLLDKANVEVNTVASGKFKNAGSPFEKFTDEQREYFGDLVDDIYGQFVEDVAEARKLERSKVEQYADGRIFTGRRAAELKFIDEVGTFSDAVDWVKSEAGMKGEPKLAYPPKDSMGFLSRAVEGVTNTVSNELKSSQTPLLEYRFLQP
jgi:protease-4